MNLTISGHHLDVTPALHSYVVSKLERVVRHFDQVVNAAVILVVDPHTEKETRQKAEISLRLKGKVIFVACVPYLEIEIRQRIFWLAIAAAEA